MVFFDNNLSQIRCQLQMPVESNNRSACILALSQISGEVQIEMGAQTFLNIIWLIIFQQAHQNEIFFMREDNNARDGDKEVFTKMHCISLVKFQIASLKFLN